MCSVQTDLDCTYTMKRKIDLYSTFFLLTKVWMPSTWVISYIINMSELCSTLFQRSICSYHFIYLCFTHCTKSLYLSTFVQVQVCGGVCVAHHFNFLGFFLFFLCSVSCAQCCIYLWNVPCVFCKIYSCSIFII
jgi:hypothetical protein